MNAEKPSRDNGSLWIILPFALAVLGTIVMLFTNSANMLKLSLILALWAAAAGIILTSRLRRDRDEAERALADSDKRHAAELDAAKARGEHPAPASNVDVEVLREIQAELKALRTQLEDMSGRQFEYEPAALRAQARRIAELGSAASEPEPAAPRFETVEPEAATSFTKITSDAPAKSEPEQKPAPKPEPAEKKDNEGPSTADTARIQPVRDAEEPKRKQTRPAGAPTSDAIAGRLGAQPSARAKEHNPLSQLISERQAEAAKSAKPEAPKKQEPKKPEPKPEPKPAPEPEPKPAEEPAPAAASVVEHRRGRRRRDERGSNAISVAELLARRNKES